ncbi:hypothetical protein M8120_23680 [Microcystis aeruginosa str. Chao 1910]|nr:hypothetical protein [Microcystis aeruginosa]UZO75698.1 hypothetical protein M8120_23680 [Microcystis aeruginosa str. Chao 1910]
MKETTPAAMPPCFDRWCRRFDNCFKRPLAKVLSRSLYSNIFEDYQLLINN